jgi:hypothetical protein
LTREEREVHFEIDSNGPLMTLEGYISEEVEEWLLRNTGLTADINQLHDDPEQAACIYHIGTTGINCTYIGFAQPEHAVLFKLTFGARGAFVDE